MAYSGTLLTLGGEKFPLKWIYKDSYTVTPHAFDLDSTRVATGDLIRNVLDHRSCTVSFQSTPMTFEEYDKMWEFIRSKYIIVKEKKLRVAYYNFETGGLEAMDAYMPDTPHNPYMIAGKERLMYSTPLEFIGY